MKTNHRRGFVARGHRDQAMYGTSGNAPLAGKRFGAGIGNDFVKGNRGMAKDKKGAKKFVRSRIRFHENAATKRATSELPD